MTMRNDALPTLRLVGVDHPDARSLQEAQQSELGELIGFRGFALADPPQFRAPRGAFLVAHADDKAIAGGGLCPLEALGSTAEVKRMYTLPGWRRRGLGVRILHALEVEARVLGYRSTALETGTIMHWAIALFESRGHGRTLLHPPFLMSEHRTYLGKTLFSDANRDA
jgi:GNAT superfamily N-acetyltransferase